MCKHRSARRICTARMTRDRLVGLALTCGARDHPGTSSRGYSLFYSHSPRCPHFFAYKQLATIRPFASTRVLWAYGARRHAKKRSPHTPTPIYKVQTTSCQLEQAAASARCAISLNRPLGDFPLSSSTNNVGLLPSCPLTNSRHCCSWFLVWRIAR